MNEPQLQSIETDLDALRPHGDFVLAERLPDEESSILFVPDKPTGMRLGRVMKVGPGDIDAKTGKRHPMHVKVGDKIAWWRCPANEVRLNGKDYTFLHEQQHICAVIGE